MKSLKKGNGITLISLVVTIIILLILAGISIQLIGGSNGILSRASNALDANDKATATEKMELKITYLNMVSYGENTRKASLQELADGLCADEEMQYVLLESQKTATLAPIEVGEAKSIFTKLKKYPYEFEINSDLQLASVDGVKIATTTKDGSYDELKVIIDEMRETIEQNRTTIGQLNTKITSLEQKNAALESTVQQFNRNEGLSFTRLLDTQSTTSTEKTVTLTDNLNNYKYVMVAMYGSANFYSSGFLSVEEFKNLNRKFTVANHRERVIVNYINDTTCTVFHDGDVVSNTMNAVLYGIK